MISRVIFRTALRGASCVAKVRKMKSVFPMTAVLLSAVLAGCGGAGNGDAADAANRPAVVASRLAQSPHTAPAGGIRLALSGASGCGFEHAWVTVQAIRIYRTDAAADTDSSPSELTLSPPRRIDLVGLAGGLLAELGTAALPAGHYEAMRLVLAENGMEGAPDALANAVQVSGASPTPLATPAGVRSGIKVPLQVNVAEGQTAEVVLAFDPCTSIVQAGSSGRYILRPTIAAALLAQRFVAGPAKLVKVADPPPLVAALAGGGYVVVWSEAPYVIRAQRYNAAGEANGGELLLFEDAPAAPMRPYPRAVTGLPGGGFAIATSGTLFGSPTVFAFQFDASGAAVGSAQPVFTTNLPLGTDAADIDAMPDGGYLVTGSIRYWVHPDSGLRGDYVRRFDASGAPAGEPIMVRETYGQEFGSDVSVSTSVLSNGGWVTAFDQLFARWASPPTRNRQSFVNIYSGSGALVTSTNINPYSGADELSPATAALKDGNYVAAWRVNSFVDGLSLPQIQLRVFDPGGAAVSAVMDFDPPVDVGGLPIYGSIPATGGPKLTALADGGFLLSFAQAGPLLDSEVSIFGQYFDAAGQALGPMFKLGTSSSYSLAATTDGGFVFTSSIAGALYETQFKPAGGL